VVVVNNLRISNPPIDQRPFAPVLRMLWSWTNPLSRCLCVLTIEMGLN